MHVSRKNMRINEISREFHTAISFIPAKDVIRLVFFSPHVMTNHSNNRPFLTLHFTAISHENNIMWYLHRKV